MKTAEILDYYWVENQAGEKRGVANAFPRCFTADGNAVRLGVCGVFYKRKLKGVAFLIIIRKKGRTNRKAKNFKVFSGVALKKGLLSMSIPKDKYKFALWLYPETLDKVKELYRQDDCKSKSEFIEKAIRFYIGHLTADDDTSYLPNALISNLKSIVAESDNRQNRMLFKLSVEMAMMMNVLAANSEIDEESLIRLRGECVKEVKRLNGSFSFDDAVDWQKGY